MKRKSKGRRPRHEDKQKAHPTVVRLNKPYGVLCQFRAKEGRTTLADLIALRGIYPAGRLDADSEGLVLLTDHGRLQHALSDPRRKVAKTYWVQVENVPGAEALERLAGGVTIGARVTRPARVRVIGEPPGLWLRDPPIRARRRIPTAWLEITLREGRNRQIRRMTAAVDHPTLRLIRIRIGPYALDALGPGEWARAPVAMPLPRD